MFGRKSVPNRTHGLAGQYGAGERGYGHPGACSSCINVVVFFMFIETVYRGKRRFVEFQILSYRICWNG